MKFMRVGRGAIIISCSEREARTIRQRAEVQHRNISGYILHILLRAITYEERLLERVSRPPALHPDDLIRDSGSARTTVLLRCSSKDAKRIRAAAKRRDATISAFILYFLRQSWKATDRPASAPSTLLKQNAQDCPTLVDYLPTSPLGSSPHPQFWDFALPD